MDEESIWLPCYTSAELHEAQQADPDLTQMFSWLEDKVTPMVHELYLSSPALKQFWLTQTQLILVDGVLHYQWVGENTKLLMVPQSMKSEILEGCHDCPTSGHLGQHKTLSQVKKSFLWHEMQQDVIDYVRTCPKCNKNKKPWVKPKAGLGCFRAGAPMEWVHMDMLGPFPPSEQGNKYILVMVDQFTKWVEIHALPDVTAIGTAKCAVDQFFSRFGTFFKSILTRGETLMAI